MDKQKSGAAIERGIITKVIGETYRVKSYTRSNVETPPIPAVVKLCYCTCEYCNSPVCDKKIPLKEGDKVFFCLFDDGTGIVIGKMG